MNSLCEGRVVIVTGAGRGIGREHALMLAEHGAKVVVNDVGAARDGMGRDVGPAQEVVAEIAALGGDAIANTDDVSDWDGARHMVEQAIARFGDLHGLVNNAGILRDRMLVNMTEEEWDSVINVHLKGTFAPSHFAAGYWREKAKAGEAVNASIVNTTSVSGIYGNIGQSNYGAAKMGVAAFTIIASRELVHYGVRVNAVAPGALTRMTEDIGMGQGSEEQRARMHPRFIAPIVTWLCAAESADVNGRVFEASGEMLAVAEGWHRGPTVGAVDDPTLVAAVARRLVAGARPNAGMDAEDLDGDLLT